MKDDLTSTQRVFGDAAVWDTFLEATDEQSFSQLFDTFTPQLIAFFRSRRCGLELAEDLAQEVMLTVYRKAAQIRDRKLLRGWLFKVANNALCRHSGKRKREVETVNLEDVPSGRVSAGVSSGGTPAFEFLHWITFLDSVEQDVMKLRFLEQWEYREIAAARAIPIGTVQWRVFNAKRKLVPYLTVRPETPRKAA